MKATKKLNLKRKPAREPSREDRRSRIDSNWELQGTDGAQILKARPLSRLDWLVHGFSTRLGGSSRLESATRPGGHEPVLNLGFTEWDQRSRVVKNRKKFAAAIGAGNMRMMTMRQIHSDLAHCVDGSTVATSTLQGDALLTRDSQILLTVQTADCVPILLADPRTRAVAAIHSGWRGTLKRIAEKTLGRMRMEFGTRAEDVIAVLGPAIGVCCYEVGHEVAKEFAAQFPQARGWFEGPFNQIATGDNDPNWLPWLTMAPPGHAPEPPRAHLNLIGANRDILAGAGVCTENIFSSDLCTSCRTDLFFSYRRGRQTGRMMAVIGIL